MSTRLAFAAVAVFASLSVASRASAADEVPLQWKWEKGAKFAIESVRKTHTRTVTTGEGVNETEEEDETASNHLLAQVDDVPEKGPVSVTITLRKFDIVQTSVQKTLEMHGSWSEDGKPHVTVKFESAALGAMRGEAESVLRGVGSNLLALKVKVELSRAGEVLSAKGEGDITAGIDRSSPVRRIIVATMERMLTVDDLAQSMVGEAFPQLAAAPPAAGAKWPVKRRFSLMGLTMRGKGAGSVVKSDAAAPEIRHAEETVYEIDSKGFSKMLEAVFAEAAPGAKISATLRPERSAVVRYTGRFDSAAGHPLEWSTPKLDLVLVGSVSVAIEAAKVTMNLRAALTGDVVCRWTRL